MIHIGMSDLSASTVMACYDLTINNDSTANTRSQCNHDHIGGTCCRTFPRFAKSSHIGIIASFCMKSCQFLHFSCNILVTPVKVYRPIYLTFGVYRSRNADSNTFYVVFGNAFLFDLGIYGCCHIRKDLISVILLAGRNLPFLNKSSVCAEKSAFYSCSTYINSKTICSHFLSALTLRHPDFLFFSQDLPVHACTEPLPHCIPSSSVCG